MASITATAAGRGKRKILCKVVLGQRREKSWITIRGREMAIPAIHPDEHLGDELEELGMSATALARQIEVPTNRITEILNGQRSVTGDTALRLGRFFGTSAEFWPNLQKLYELRRAERKTGDRIESLPTLDSLAAAPRTRTQPLGRSRLPLGELLLLAGALEPVLLALLLSRVPGKETTAFEDGTQGRIHR